MKLWIVILNTLFSSAFSPVGTPVIEAQETLALSLEDCFRRAMNENLGLRSARLGLQYDKLAISQATAAFDPSLSFRVNRAQSGSPNYASYIPVDKIEQKQSSANFTLGQSIFTGGSWGFGAYNALSESNIERIKNYSSYVGLSFNQPLLKGRGKKTAYSGVYLARLSGDASIHTVEEKAITLLAQVERAYWNLVYARETLAVREMALAQAESLLVYNEKGRDLGVLVQSDVLEARSAYLSRKQEVLEQKNQIRIAEDEIKLLLSFDSSDGSDQQLIPTALPYVPEIDSDVSVDLKAALRNRPDYLLALSDIAQLKIRLGTAGNALLPSLDLSASYRLNGSGGTFDRNLRRIGDADAFGWNVGLNLSYPIYNRSARTDFERQEILAKRAQLDLDALRERILTDIRSGMRNVNTNRERIEVAKLAIEANEMKLRAEEEKFRNHLSTSYLVLQYQTDLANARNQFNRALMDCMLSVLELRQARGTLLSDLNIQIIPLEQ